MTTAATTRVPAVCLAVLMLATACRAASDDAADVDGQPLAAGAPVLPTVDSAAGIVTMTHDAAAFDRAPSLAVEPTPLAILGAADDEAEYDLTSVTEVVLLSDGRTATRSAIGARILVFGPDGRGERVVGRMGRGPGEFVRAESLVRLAGDTLLILDTANGRLNRIHPASGSADASPVASERDLFHAAPLSEPLPDGRLVLHVASVGPAGEVGTVFRGPGSVALLGRDAAPPRTIAEVPGWEYATVETRYRGRRRPNAEFVRFGRQSHVAVRDSTIVTGAGDAYALDLRTPDGTIRARIQATRPRRVVTSAMRDAAVARELAVYDGALSERLVDAGETRRLVRERPTADSLPPYDALMTSRDGTLWVVDAIAPTDTAWSATAFRADGAITGRLHASARGRPMAFEGDRVAVRTEDVDGIVTVRIHRIRAANAP